MPRDNQYKMSSKKDTKSSNSKKRQEEDTRRKKYNESSSDDEDSYYDEEEEETEEELDQQEYRKFLRNLYPSKYMDKKVKAGDKLKKVLKEDEENYKQKLRSSKRGKEKYESKSESEGESESEYDEAEYESETSKTNKRRKSPSNKKKNNKKHYDDEDNDEDEEELGSEDSETEEEEEEQDKKVKKNNKSAKKFNIIFTIADKKKKYRDEEDEYEEDDEEEWETCSESESDDSETENEDDPISSDSEEEEEDSPKKKSKKIKKKEEKNTHDETKTNNVIDMLKEFQSKNENDELVNECLRVCSKKLELNKQKQEKKTLKEKDRNVRIFRRILRDKNTMNDFDFYHKLDTTQQNKIIKELREINKITRIEKPYRLTLLESDMPVIFKAAAMKKISSLRYMEPGSGEYYKIKNWVDTFMRVPFGEYKTLPISIEDGIEKCHEFMATAQKTLNDAVYGLNDAKMQIMQMLGQLITNPSAIGSAIAIHGPPGTGKTSLVKEGISKILNRPFAFIALGGATDSSFLEGHSYTYEGSTWGKIVQILIDSKCMNPVIYFDELDKISDTPKGEEIAGILTHLTDTSQNTQFHDKYFAEIDFDLSKCLFIFSYNDESKVNPILKDRMYRIQTKGYNQKQKTTISNQYLLPRIREQVKFADQDIIIPDTTLQYIIDGYCLKEDGVRNLKRCLEIIHTKLNLYRLMIDGTNLFEEDMSLKVEFPLTVTKEVVDKLIKKVDSVNPSLYYMYI
jgi:ATP-dependent Lon protease